MRALFEALRESATIPLIQTPTLSPPLSLARFSVFPFRPSNLGLFEASLQTHAPEKNSEARSRWIGKPWGGGKNMLSQESQKMCLECSVAIKCELLKNFKNLKFENSQLTVGFKLALCPCSSGGYMYARRWRETIWESTSVSSSPSKGTYHKRCEEWKTTEMASSHLENLYDENHDTTDIQTCYVSRQPAMNYKKKCMYVTQLRKLHLLIGFDTTENKSLTCSSFTRTQRKNWTVRTSA